MSAWGITDGSAGMAAQVKALALALNQPIEMKKITLRKPFAWLPNMAYASPLRSLILPYGLDPASDTLAQPWPELVISCGRKAALVAMAMRAKMQGCQTRFIHIQDPQVSARYFDLVVAMQHDKITGPNVLKTRFALHAITPQTLEEARQKFAPVFAGYAKPHVAVLLGGSTNKYHLSKEIMAHIIVWLQQVLQSMEGSLLITPSRRTGEENIAMLRNCFANNPRVYIYDFIEENPYMGMLALADTIIVTNDSVNMMSEAYATGKPLYLLPLPGHANTKPARFASTLLSDGIARLLGKRLERWDYPVVDVMGIVAQGVEAKLH